MKKHMPASAGAAFVVADAALLQTRKNYLEKIVEKMSHAVADCFQIKERGYIREGYYADLVIVDLNRNTTVTKENILYKCGWSPLEGYNISCCHHTYFCKWALGLWKWSVE